MTPADPVPTIGMEVHLHLKTRTKMFCACPVRYDARPNSCVCPVCLGMPGVLPVMNGRAVELAVRMAMALGCTIPGFAKWDRKHYYYPDLPKNYQISEYDQPLGVGGRLDLALEGRTFRVGITRVHLEEDAGKLMHAEDGSNASVVDLNRTGTPLLEIVSEPDIHSAEEARAYAEALRQLAVYLDVGDCNMQLGQMRFEPNISLCLGAGPDGKPRYTPITEIKNLNSFRSVERAVAFEIARHREELVADPKGYTLERLGKSTRGWDDERGLSFLQRSKEEAHDYRYFPEPDLVPFVPAAEWLQKVRDETPETPEQEIRRLSEKYGLPEWAAAEVARERQYADYFSSLADPLARELGAVAPGRQREAVDVALNFLDDVRRIVNERKISIADFKCTPDQVADLLVMVETGEINRAVRLQVFTQMLETGKTAEEIVAEENLAQTSDAGQIEALVDQVLAANPGTAADYKAGKQAALGRLIGETMKASGRKANPQVVREVLIRKLGG